ncbi:MAG: inositol monophosphatase family protein [Pseudomonadota bacterium]|jgi:fructose-1,6-bisphosphatase/inositol monophosphatase family enzyme
MISEAEAIAELESGVRQAGRKLLELWPAAASECSALGVRSKPDGSLVSRADMESNQILVELISRLFPDDAILSEESPLIGASERVWIIDPLDGTKSFLNGLDDFSILVALCEDGAPRLGMMFFPARGLFVKAIRGGAATVNGELIKVSGASELLQGRVYIRNFECKRPELASPMMDSGLALLKVANGELDGAIIRMSTHREWDIAAPMAVLLSAGGAVSDETGAQIRLGKNGLECAYFIASNGRIHKQLQGLI